MLKLNEKDLEIIRLRNALKIEREYINTLSSEITRLKRENNKLKLGDWI